jgi:hypothetical protein
MAFFQIISCNNGSKRSGQGRLTDDGKVHLEAHKLEELEAIHVRHVDITDHQVKLVLVLPQQLQGRGRLSSCCHCDVHTSKPLAREPKTGTSHYTDTNQRFEGIRRKFNQSKRK